jgi:integral membrane protein (TIGR00529 family)
MEFPAIIKILSVFFGVLLINRFKVPLGIALILGGLLLDTWAGNNLPAVSMDFLRALIRPELWLLTINITLIMEIGHFMASEKNSQAILGAAQRWGGKHGFSFSLVLIPAAIGMVPMPGGALFSAPLVGRTVENSTQAPEWKAAVNYWFRHILEYWWPLYPVVIVTLSIFTLDTWKYMAVQIPFTLVSVFAGYFFLLRSFGKDLFSDAQKIEAPPSLTKVLAPIMIIVAATLLLPGIFKYLTPGLSPASWKLLAMFTGLIVALIMIRQDQQKDDRKLFDDIISKKTLTVLFTLGGVMVFESLLDASDLIPLAGQELSRSQVPMALIIGFLPFLAGLVTGIAIGFAGTSFPIVVGFVSADPSLEPIAALVLAFSMGYAGMMLSPVHLCFLLTVDYFSASFIKVYRYLLPCVLCVMFWGIIMYLLLETLS